MRFLSLLIFLYVAVSNVAPAQQFSYSPLSSQNPDVSWPVEDWERAPFPSTVDKKKIDQLAADLFNTSLQQDYGVTHLLLVAYQGKIVFEQYAPGYKCDGITHTMSIAKMLGSILAGVMEREGMLDIRQPAPIPEWYKKADDSRRKITSEQILQMTTGQEWSEFSDFLELAFGDGFDDLAAYAAEKPLAYEPGTHFQYSDGAPGLISHILQTQQGWSIDQVASFIQRNIFDAINMRDTEAEYDSHGTWYGSSGVRWSPCDLARFSLMMMRDGTWNGQRILPEGWINRMRTPSQASLAPVSGMRDYGAGYGYTAFVYDLDYEADPIAIDAFGHLGFGGHVLRLVPSKDMIVILLGTHALDQQHLNRIAATKSISDLFPNALTAAAQTLPSSEQEE